MDTGAERQDQSGNGETADAQPWVGGSSVVMFYSVVTYSGRNNLVCVLCRSNKFWTCTIT